MIVEQIVWADHVEPVNNGNVWWSPDDLEQESGPMAVTSVRWVMKGKDDGVLIVSQLLRDGWANQPLVIIKSCVIARTVLQVKQPTKEPE